MSLKAYLKMLTQTENMLAVGEIGGDNTVQNAVRGLQQAIICKLRREFGGATVSTNEMTNEEIAACTVRGNRIEAIKLVRERTGMGLKDAKDLVENKLFALNLQGTFEEAKKQRYENTHTRY